MRKTKLLHQPSLCYSRCGNILVRYALNRQVEGGVVPSDADIRQSYYADCTAASTYLQRAEDGIWTMNIVLQTGVHAQKIYILLMKPKQKLTPQILNKNNLSNKQNLQPRSKLPPTLWPC